MTRIRLAWAAIIAIGLMAAIFGLVMASTPAAAEVAQNRPPVAAMDSASTTEDTAVSVAVLANDSDPDGDVLTVTAVDVPAHGTAVIIGGATVTYTPAANFTGTDSFTYTISDGHGGTDTAAIVVTVSAANDAPIAMADSVSAIAGRTIEIAVLANDSDVDGDMLSISSVGTPSHGAATITGTRIRYAAAADFAGIDSFTYGISDGHGGIASAMVTVTVTAPVPPVRDGDDERDGCKDGGWRDQGFRNQGLCVASQNGEHGNGNGAPWPSAADWDARSHGHGNEDRAGHSEEHNDGQSEGHDRGHAHCLSVHDMEDDE